jgi:hypothetical protein
MTTLTQYLLRKKVEALNVIAAREDRRRRAKARYAPKPLRLSPEESAYARGQKMGLLYGMLVRRRAND